MKPPPIMNLVCLFLVCLNLDISFARSEERDSQCNKCGRSHPKNFLIINGNIVYPSFKYPWVVGVKKVGADSIHCGGAIINRNYILTAAHCIQNFNARIVGKNRCKAEDGSKTSCKTRPSELRIRFLNNREAKVSKVIAHPGFFSDSNTDDIALLKLQKPIKCDKYKSRICLPPKNYDLEKGSDVIVTGWGQTTVGATSREISPLLKEGRLRTDRAQAQCGEGATNPGRSGKRPVYCLSGKDKDGPCFGDSGGIAFSSDGSQYFAIGVVSRHTSETCDLEKPAMYTSVPSYRSWIIRNSEYRRDQTSERFYLSSHKTPGVSYGAGHAFFIKDLP